MTYQQILKEKEIKISELIEKSNMFFAFSNKQLTEGMAKNPIEKGEKYASLGCGIYLPKKNIDIYKEGMSNIKNWVSNLVKENKLEEQEILYAICNHECYYTYDIKQAYESLGAKYTKEKIWEVFDKFQAEYDN
jgi:hypothetical protein